MKKYNLGFTLIELMIAMVIGILLLAGTASLFISNKRIYKDQNEMSRLQENARFAMEMLIKDIRMAGYAGCLDRIDDVANHVNGSANDDTLLNFGNAVEGSESAANWEPSDSTQATPGNPVDGSSPDDATTIQMDPNSDAISVKYLAPLGISLSDEMPNVSAELKVTSLGDLQIGELVALSDCDSADIMQLTNVQTTAGQGHLQHNAGGALNPGNDTQTLSKVYSTDAEVLRLTSIRYFVGTSDTTGELALFRYKMDREDFDNDGDTTEFVAQEMIEGVENMQILFGEDTAGNDTIADTYVDASAVTNWDNVVSVRIALLMRTIEEDFSQDLNTNTYDLLGTNYDPPDDRRRRRVFSNTIQVRNRSN
jgi:type IV pilus assembly protein PilW